MSGPSVLFPAIRQQCKHIAKRQCRSFTSTSPIRRKSGMRSVPSHMVARRAGSRLRSADSMEKRLRNVKRHEVSDDLGLLPATLILPASKDMPSLLSTKKADWKFRWNVYKYAVMLKIQEYFMMWKRGDFWPIDERTNKPVNAYFGFMQSKERYKIARDLYTQLMEAIAVNDEATISRIACTGLKRQLQLRIDKDRAENKLRNGKWSIKFRGFTSDYQGRGAWLLNVLIPPRFKSTRVLLDRCTALPLGLDTKMRQTIVNIKSTEIYDKGDGDAPKTKNVNTNFVLQRLQMHGEQEHWRIWGMTDRPNREEAEKIIQEFKMQEGMHLSGGQRIQQMQEQNEKSGKSMGDLARELFGGKRTTA